MQVSLKCSPLSATALAVFCALGLSAQVPVLAGSLERTENYAKLESVNNANNNKPKTPSKPISWQALRKAIKVAADSSTPKLRRELMSLIGEQINQSGVDFLPAEADQSALRELGATDELLDIVARKAAERATWLEQQDWKAAQASDESATINAFLEKYPASQFVAEARERIEDLHWKNAQAQAQASDYTAYLATYLESYPSGKYASAAQARLEQLAWQAAQAGGRADDFTEFLEKYPQGQFASSAQSRLSQIAWEKLKNSKDIQRYQSFVEKYPQGTLADAARIRIEQLRWEAVLSSGKQSDFEAYLKQYPEGHFVKAAHNRIERINNPSKDEEKAEEVVPVKLQDEELRQYLTREVPMPPGSESVRKRVPKVRIVLSVMGTVQTIEPLGGSKSARAAAIETVSQWMFRPVEREGKAVVAEGILTLRYADTSAKTGNP